MNVHWEQYQRRADVTMKHTIGEHVLLIIIAVILTTVGIVYENSIALIIAGFVYGYFLGCEIKKRSR